MSDILSEREALIFYAEQRGYARAMEAERKLHEARIEELEAEIERLRGDLAKAMEALGEIATDEHPLGWIAITALVELTGGKDDRLHHRPPPQP